MKSTIEEICKYSSDDGKRTAIILRYETEYLIQMQQGEESKLLEVKTLDSAENAAKDWVRMSSQ